MATTDLLMHLRPQDAFPEAGGNPAPDVTVGFAKGLAFNSLTDSGAVWIGRLPVTAALATGFTFQVMIAEDANNIGVAKAVRMAITVKKLAGGTDVISAAGAGTETGGTLTLPSTAGVVLTGTITIVIANADGVAAGDWVMIRVRRLGTNAADTHRGRVVLLGVDVRDT